MKFHFIPEPDLRFATGDHICARRGIAAYGVFDKTQAIRRDEVHVGAVGSNACLEALGRWLERCAGAIEPPDTSRHPNLHVRFTGFNRNSGYHAAFVSGNDLSRAIKNSEIEEALKIADRRKRIEHVIELYYEHIKFLAQNRPVDVIVCVMPEALHKRISTEETYEEESLESTVDVKGELNFRRAIKARAMHLGKPLQLVRAVSLESNRRGQQDDATKAWNFCTALYYKAAPTVPWKLAPDESRVSSCAVGIAFYRSRDYQSLNTSLAQIFDELGNGLILRGTPVDLSKDDRVPHLTGEQAFNLLKGAMQEYRIALRSYPGRIVIHKSSRFTDDEIDGLKRVAHELRIDQMDFVTILDSKLRLFRNGSYPPLRGSMLSLDEGRNVLYTRGSVWYYKTYPGLYIPQPIELRIVKSDQSPLYLATEVLGLTKMNWNNTQFDGKYPVTLGCARKVGEIMKYIPDSEQPQIRYGYYM